MKFAAFACLASLMGASAFVAPAPKQMRSRSMARMAVDDLIGADVETGGIFDPLNFSKDADKLDKFRAVELKHGRIAMLGVLGIWIQAAGLHLPDPVFSNPRPLAALVQVSTERPLALVQLLAAITWIELVAGKQSESQAPGDLAKFGNQFKPEDEEEYAALQLKELKNGRLAMIASMGLLVQELVTGQGIWEQLSSGNVWAIGDGKGLL